MLHNKNVGFMKKTSLGPYYCSFFRNNTKDFIIGMIATVAESACSVGIAWLIQQLLDACTGNSNALPFYELLAISTGLLLLFLGMIQLDRITTSRFIPKAMAQYKSFLFSRISRKSIAAFRQENTATYLSAIANDTQSIQMGICDLFNGANSLLTLICAVCLMVWYSPIMTLAALSLAALFFILSLPFSKKLVEAEKELSDCNEGLTARFKDFLTGFPVVKSFQAEKEMGILFSEDVGKSANADKKRRMANLMFYFTIDGGIAVARICILLVGAYLSITGRGVSAGMVIAFAELLNHVMAPMQQLPLCIADLKAANALIRKAADNLEKNIRDEGKDFHPVLETGLELRNLSFAYESGKPVLQNISHTFESGKRYALVGASGCGKSTLLQLLMGGSTYDGEILCDGQELQGISSRSLYALASLISQNVFLFNATIMENVTMFRDFPQDETERALQLSGLSQLIFQKGTDFLCGENGCNLSGGEKQRISIARCLLRKSSLLLVDEATSSLDAMTATQVSQALLDLTGVTEIVVTHTLDAQILRQYDEVIAIKGGNMIETGTFDELMEKKGYFYSLYTVSQ